MKVKGVYQRREKRSTIYMRMSNKNRATICCGKENINELKVM
jgi:hypothetical protein